VPLFVLVISTAAAPLFLRARCERASICFSVIAKGAAGFFSSRRTRARRAASGDPALSEAERPPHLRSRRSHGLMYARPFRVLLISTVEGGIFDRWCALILFPSFVVAGLQTRSFLFSVLRFRSAVPSGRHLRSILRAQVKLSPLTQPPIDIL